MDFGLDRDQQDLQKSLRKFLSDFETPAARRGQTTNAPDTQKRLWAGLVNQGLTGIGIPETHGGAGATIFDLIAVSEELGRDVTMSPFFGSAVLASSLLTAAEPSVLRAGLLDGLASGRVASVALLESRTGWKLFDRETMTVAEGEHNLLSGTKEYVLDGSCAANFIVLAKCGGTLGLFVVDSDADGVSVDEQPTLDLSRPMSKVTFTRAPAKLLAFPDIASTLDRTLDVARVVLAAEQMAGARRCLEMSVNYSRIRSAFGRTIGSFQAIKHMCAEMYLLVEAAEASMYRAAWALHVRHAESTALVSAAQLSASRAYFTVAKTNIQVHGGIGVTWEHQAHLYLKRAAGSLEYLGSPEYYQERIARELGLLRESVA